MVTGLVIIIFAGFLWGVIGIFFSYIARKGISFPAVMAPVGGVCFIFTFLIFTNHRILFNGEIPFFKELTAAMIISGLFSSAAFMLMQSALKMGHHGMIWTISQSAMAVPFLFGVLVFNDNISYIKFSGMGLILLSFIAFGLGEKNNGRKMNSKNYFWFWQALIVFLLLGIQQSLTTLPSYWDGWADTASLRTPVIFSGVFLGYLFFMIMLKQYPDKQTLKLSLYIIILSIPGQDLIFRGIDYLSKENMAAIAYPAAVGTTILTFVLYSLIFLREKTSKALIFGLLTALAGMILVSS